MKERGGKLALDPDLPCDGYNHPVLRTCLYPKEVVLSLDPRAWILLVVVLVPKRTWGISLPHTHLSPWSFE
jgi:hypothetical protein